MNWYIQWPDVRDTYASFEEAVDVVMKWRKNAVIVWDNLKRCHVIYASKSRQKENQPMGTIYNDDARNNGKPVL